MKIIRSPLIVAALKLARFPVAIVLPIATVPLFATDAGILSGQRVSPQEAGSEQENAIEALRELAEASGVSITWTGGPREEEHDWGSRSWRDAADWEIQAYAPILTEELSLYPESLLRRAQVKEIILCRDLWVEAEGVNQHVSGTLDHGTGTLFLSVAYTYKVNNRPKQRRVIHHALFHQLDFVMGAANDDPAWERLNPDGFIQNVISNCACV